MSRVRIVGGTHRSRLIDVTSVKGLRPTPDRVRETLFNWLGQDLTGWRCLDLFAGSGALGFEAASRGAEASVLVESHPRAWQTLQESAQSLGLPAVQLVKQDALRYLGSQPAVFDLIFLDPPYHQGWLEKVLPLLERVSKADTLLYVEAEHPLDSLGRWQTYRRGTSGQVHFQLMQIEENMSEV